MHHSIKSYKEDVEKIHNDIVKMCDITKQYIKRLREDTHDFVNRNRLNQMLKININDIVFVLNHYHLREIHGH